MSYKVIVFDWDGTLFDSMTYKKQNAGLVFEKILQGPRDKVSELFINYSGIPRQALFQKIASELDLSFSDKIFNQLSTEFSALNVVSAQSAQVYEDVESVLSELAKNYALYISSSSAHAELTQIVQSKGLTKYFQQVWGSQTGFAKGSEHFAKILTLEGCTILDLLFLGDDKADARLATESNVSFVGVSRHAPSVFGDEVSTISNLNELVSYL